VTTPLRVAIVGCGSIGRKRADAVGDDQVIGCFDVLAERADELAAHTGSVSAADLPALLELSPDVVVVSTIHSELASAAEHALRAGAHVLVEKPAGRNLEDVERIRRAASEADRLVKVGFNHRFHDGIHRAVSEALSGEHGPIMFVRARYGHGGRVGYETEWRADPALSGGGELVDQGMHLLDLCHWILGELPVCGSLIRTQFWNAPVEDNGVLLLGERGAVGDRSPWAMIHASWTEWKNMFSLEIYCRDAKFDVEGLVRSYGPQRLAIHRMRPELGPPDTEIVEYPDVDGSWEAEWSHFAGAVRTADGRSLLGDLGSAAYAWRCIEAATS
jgi:predicted dehydrogenase